MRRFVIAMLGLGFAGCAAPEATPVDTTPTPIHGVDIGPYEVPRPQVLTLVHIDVGQGDSTLIKGPERSILVDGGDQGMGNQVVRNALHDHGVEILDWVVATHPHADHIGGLDEVLIAVDVLSGVFDNGDTSNTQAYYNYRDAANASTGGKRLMTVGTIFDLGAGATATCVAVNGTLIDGSQVAVAADRTNDRSIALLVEWGDFRYIIAGDLGGVPTQYVTDVETSLAPLIGDVDVMRVSHHGSAYSTNALWLNTLKPEAAVLSLGDGNDYGHPSSAALSRLTGADSSVTVPAPDLWLTEKGYAPSPMLGVGTVVIEATPTLYRINDQLYDATNH